MRDGDKEILRRVVDGGPQTLGQIAPNKPGTAWNALSRLQDDGLVTYDADTHLWRATDQAVKLQQRIERTHNERP